MLLMHRVVFLSKLVHLILSTTVGSNSQICGNDLCLERLGEIDVNDSRRFLQQNCFCDNECMKYQDCCLDISNGSQMKSEFKCIHVPGLDHGAYMIGHCPSTWTNIGVENWCQNPDPEDPFSTIPIYNPDKNISYKNMYCAVCHSETEESLISWIVNVKCQSSEVQNKMDPSEMNNIFFNKTRGRWYLISDDQATIQTACYLSVRPQSMIYRPCKIIIESCAKNWTARLVEMKCKNINAYRYQNNNDKYIVYKNTYCALCNSVETKKLNCFDSAEVVFDKPNLNYSLSWALDLHYESITAECGFGEVYDAFSHTCRNVLCPDCLMNVKDIGKLRNSNTTDMDGNLKCHIHILRQSQYEITETGIWVLSVKKMLLSNLYFLDHKKTLYVCDPKEKKMILTRQDASNLAENPKMKENGIDFEVTQAEYPIETVVNIEEAVSNEIKPQIITTGSQLTTLTPVQIKYNSFCFKITLQLSEFTNFNPQTQSFFVPMLNRTFFKGDYSLDDHYHPIICDPVDMYYNAWRKCWKIALHPWAYKYQNGSLFVDIVNKQYQSNEYSFNEKREPVICVLVEPQTNQNKDVVCVKMVIPQSEMEFNDNLIYVRKFDKIFNSSQYFVDEGHISICLAPLTVKCSRVMVQKSDYSLQSDNTIYVSYMNRTFHPNEYELINGNISVCIQEMYQSEPRFSSAQGIVTIVGLGISITCLALHLLVYFFTADQKHLGCKNVAILAATLMVAQSLWLLHPIAKGVTIVCTIIAVLGHFMYLASFAWMGIISFDVWRTFSRKYHHQHSCSSDRSRFLKYSICAWGMPITIMVTAILIDFLIPKSDFHPCYQSGKCWIYQRKALLVFFIIPLAIILFANIFLFILTLYNIFKAFTAAKKARRQEIHEVLISCKLAILMGLTWMVGFAQQRQEIQYLFIILNSLQGVFIFVGFTFNKSVRRNLGATVAKISVHRQFSNSSSVRTDDTDFSYYKRTLSCRRSQSICTDPSAGYPRSKTWTM